MNRNQIKFIEKSFNNYKEFSLNEYNTLIMENFADFIILDNQLDKNLLDVNIFNNKLKETQTVKSFDLYLMVDELLKQFYLNKMQSMNINAGLSLAYNNKIFGDLVFLHSQNIENIIE